MPNPKDSIWDPFRKKHVVRTPEEEVRQAFASYLVRELGYPGSLIRTEYTLYLNELMRRCDILVDKPAGKPALLVECKAPGVKITQQVFEQAARYNLVFKVEYLVLTNGKQHFCCRVDAEKEKVELVGRIPGWDEL